ncbi:MAG: hypothetical protein PHX54_09875, partial [Lentimicrobiaceae bacterium]|nr:hypothetical protein [Lentimicrobiaceae bacterium]
MRKFNMMAMLQQEYKSMMVNKKRKPKIGLFFLACERFKKLGAETDGGTCEFRSRQQADELIKNLSKHFELFNEELVFDGSQVHASISCFVQNDVDLVLVVFLSWSTDAALVRLLRDMPSLPVVLYCPAKDHTVFTPERSGFEDQFIEFLCAGGLVGTLEASGSFKRQNKLVEIVTGSIATAIKRIHVCAVAAKTSRQVSQAHFGILGDYNELMWSTYVDPYSFFTEVGPEIKFLTYNSYAEAISKVSDAEAMDYCRYLAEEYILGDDVNENLFLESVRASLGLYLLARESALDAIALNDVDINRLKIIGLRPGFYCKGWNETLSVVVPEADLGAALMVFVLKQITGMTVNFVEPFYFDETRNVFSAGHAGLNDHTGANNKRFVKISPDVRFQNQPIR